MDCSVFEVSGRESTALIDQDFRLREEQGEPRISDGGGLTLQRKLDSVWEGLLAAGAAGCPVCGTRMERDRGAGHCSGCGSTLT